jgi:anti-anti-sigma factor
VGVTGGGRGGGVGAHGTGEVDAGTVPDARRVCDGRRATTGSEVVVDLREVTFLDSSGLGALIGLYHRVSDAGGHLRLVCAGVTLRLMELMNLGQVLDISTELGEVSPNGVSPNGVSPNGGAALA